MKKIKYSFNEIWLAIHSRDNILNSFPFSYFLHISDVNENVQSCPISDDDDDDGLHEMSVNVFILYLGF